MKSLLSKAALCGLAVVLAAVAAVSCASPAFVPARTPFKYDLRQTATGTLVTAPVTGARFVAADTAFRFEVGANATRMDLSMTSGNESLRAVLVPGTVYDITPVLHPGWPTVYGLAISHDGILDFAGISDYKPGSRFHVEDELGLPDLLPSFNAAQSAVLTDRYVETPSDTVDRYTNDEIRFTLGDATAAMLQGESHVFGNYRLDLLVAQEIVYHPGVYDAGEIGFSYTLVRLPASE